MFRISIATVNSSPPSTRSIPDRDKAHMSASARSVFSRSGLVTGHTSVRRREEFADRGCAYWWWIAVRPRGEAVAAVGNECAVLQSSGSVEITPRVVDLDSKLPVRPRGSYTLTSFLLPAARRASRATWRHTSESQVQPPNRLRYR
jgi:hypothetical protein